MGVPGGSSAGGSSSSSSSSSITNKNIERGTVGNFEFQEFRACIFPGFRPSPLMMQGFIWGKYFDEGKEIFLGKEHHVLSLCEPNQHVYNLTPTLAGSSGVVAILWHWSLAFRVQARSSLWV